MAKWIPIKWLRRVARISELIGSSFNSLRAALAICWIVNYSRISVVVRAKHFTFKHWNIDLSILEDDVEIDLLGYPF